MSDNVKCALQKAGIKKKRSEMIEVSNKKNYNTQKQKGCLRSSQTGSSDVLKKYFLTRFS